MKHHRSLLYYPERNGQAEATNKTLIEIVSKMNQEHIKGWAVHLPDAFWAYRSSPKSATGFSPFSLVYGMEVMSLAEVMMPFLRVLQARKKENEKGVFAAKRCKYLEGLDEKREEA